MRVEFYGCAEGVKCFFLIIHVLGLILFWLVLDLALGVNFLIYRLYE